MNKKKLSLVKYVMLVLGISAFAFFHVFQATGSSLPPLIIFDLYVGPPVAIAYSVIDTFGIESANSNVFILLAVLVINILLFIPVLYAEKFKSRKIFWVIQTVILVLYLIICLPVSAHLYM